MLPDPIELGEKRAESWYFDNVRGNEFTCCCGSVCDMERGETMSPDPYAQLVCPLCFRSAMRDKHGVRVR